MSPNLYLCLRKVARPDTWIASTHAKHLLKRKEARRVEHWDSPIPGTYEFIPGRGWYLTHRDVDIDAGYESDVSALSAYTTGSSTSENSAFSFFSNRSHSRVSSSSPSSSRSGSRSRARGEEVRYCRVLHRYLLASELEARCRWEIVVRMEGGKREMCRFFQLDDGFSWVPCWSKDGTFIHGPYRKWCIDKKTGMMRPMVRGEDLGR